MHREPLRPRHRRVAHVAAGRELDPGGQVERHVYPTVRDIEEGYQRLRTAVEGDGIPAETEGVPRDVQRAAAMGWRQPDGAAQGRAGGALAAEDGRADG